MKEERYQFLEAMGHVDERLVFQSDQPWKQNDSGQERTFPAGKAAACAALVIILGTAGIFHQQAEAMFASFTTKIARILRIEEDLAPYAEIINTSQTREGVTVTLEEVILGEDELYASVYLDWDDSVKLEEGMTDPGIGIGGDLKINGEKVAAVSCGNMGDGETEVNHEHLLSFLYGENVLPDEIREIELEIRVFLTTEETDEGIPFIFRFAASGEELQNDTVHVSLDQETKTENGITFHFRELILNKLLSRISGDYDDSLQKMDDAVYLLLGADSRGNQLKYELYSVEGQNIIFESTGALPSMDSQWIELQLYEAELSKLETTEEVDSGETEKEYIDEETEMYVVDSKIYEIDINKFSPVEEKFRVEISS